MSNSIRMRRHNIDATQSLSDKHQSPHQNPRTVQTYFNNNGNGFAQPQRINTASGIQVELYTNRLKESKQGQIKHDIHSTIDKFTTAFQLTPNSVGQGERLKVYLFNDRQDYRHLGGGPFKLGLGNEGGKFYYHRDPGDRASEMYVYQERSVRNLAHELTHALTYYTVGSNADKIPTVLIEGIAEYLQHNADDNGLALNIADCKELTAHQILHLSYSEDSAKNHLTYTVGHALVAYLQSKKPGLLKNYFEQLKNGMRDEATALLNSALENIDSFKAFISKNSTEGLIRESNALGITPGNFIATRREIVGQQIKNVHYHKAIIRNKSGKTVGAFSPIEIIGFHKKIRAINRASMDYIDLPSEYNFLKVIKKQRGYAFTYCNQKGEEYHQSTDYKNNVIQLFSKYNPSIIENIKRLYNTELEKLKSEAEKAHKDRNNTEIDLEKNNISYEQYLAKYHNETSAYKALNNFIAKEQEYLYHQIRQNPNFKDIEKILSDLTTIHRHHLISASRIRLRTLLRNNTIFSTRINGQGDTSAISVYHPNGRKLSELSTRSGFFQQVEGTNKRSFVFADDLRRLHTRYDDTAFLGITKTGSGNYQADFVQGISRSGDRYFNQRHFNANELLRPDTGIIHPDQLPTVVMEEASPILRHQDSPIAQYTQEQKRNGVVVAKGVLLDDKGSEDTADDVHSAVVQEKGQALYQFKNIGFYISEKMENHASALYIDDHGTGKRFQLPNAITHLKLVKINQQVKLVPCDKDGNEFPAGMPEDIGNYRYIDPIFAHTYAKRDYSTQHSNEGPIDFTTYPLGHLFAIQYDPNDAALPRDPQGNILRVEPDQAYFTKVKLLDGHKEIGMLSNDFSNFQGEIFLSVDYNYSYTDFLASVSPNVNIEKLPDGRTKITFGQSVGDVGGTDRGYTDHQRFYSAKATDTVVQKLTAALSADITHERSASVVQGPSSERLYRPQPGLMIDNRRRAEG